MSTILCIDDEPASGATLERALRGMGHTPVVVASLQEGLEAAAREAFDLVISDHRASDASGLDAVAALTREGREVPVIVTSPFRNVEVAASAVRRGASDYLTKPLRVEAVRLAVANAIELHRLRRLQEGAQNDLSVLRGSYEIVGSSAALRAAMELVRRVAPTRTTVLLVGESGTGKELFARALHALSPRAHQPFVTVSCAALQEGLVESTLFGREPGAFAGATSRTAGAFERAHGGTLLLDEISEMRLDLQGKLLRAIQEQEFERVGGTATVKVDLRVVATTNRDLLREVEAGRFRRDLYFRLNVMPIHTPPLRERREDLPELAEYFVRRVAGQLGVRPPVATAEALEVLRRRSWTGNVRELANAIERAVILCRDGRLTAESFRGLDPETPAPQIQAQASASGAAGDDAEALLGASALHLATLERLAIERALELTHGHRAGAAQVLGITERTLRNKITAMRIMVTRREDGPAGHPWPPRPGSPPGATSFDDPDPTSRG